MSHFPREITGVSALRFYLYRCGPTLTRRLRSSAVQPARIPPAISATNAMSAVKMLASGFLISQHARNVLGAIIGIATPILLSILRYLRNTRGGAHGASNGRYSAGMEHTWRLDLMSMLHRWSHRRRLFHHRALLPRNLVFTPKRDHPMRPRLRPKIPIPLQ